MPYTPQDPPTQPYITLHYPTLPYTTPHYPALPYTSALQSIQYIIYSSACQGDKWTEGESDQFSPYDEYFVRSVGSSSSASGGSVCRFFVAEEDGPSLQEDLAPPTRTISLSTPHRNRKIRAVLVPAKHEHYSRILFVNAQPEASSITQRILFDAKRVAFCLAMSHVVIVHCNTRAGASMGGHGQPQPVSKNILEPVADVLARTMLGLGATLPRILWSMGR